VREIVSKYLRSETYLKQAFDTHIHKICVDAWFNLKEVSTNCSSSSSSSSNC